MPWGVFSHIAHATIDEARRRDVAKERYTFGWGERGGARNDISEYFRVNPGSTSEETLAAWERYRLERNARRRQERFERRGERMSTRLERRRTAIRAKWKSRATCVVCFLVTVPVTIVVVSLLWRAAMWALVS